MTFIRQRISKTDCKERLAGYRIIHYIYLMKKVSITRTEWNLIKASLNMFLDQCEDDLRLYEDNRMDEASSEQRELLSRAVELHNKLEAMNV